MKVAFQFGNACGYRPWKRFLKIRAFPKELVGGDLVESRSVSITANPQSRGSIELPVFLDEEKKKIRVVARFHMGDSSALPSTTTERKVKDNVE